MQKLQSVNSYKLILIAILFLLSCNNKQKNKVTDVVADPVSMDSHVTDNISDVLNGISASNAKIYDSISLQLPMVVKEFYSQTNYTPIWSSAAKWKPLTDSLYKYIAQAEYEGLFPKDYHFSKLKFLKDTLDADSVTRMNAVYWTKADLLFTDGFMHLIKDLKQGRLQPDSLSLNKDSVLIGKFFIATLNTMIDKKEFTVLLNSLQPQHKGYWELKKGIKYFVDSMDRKQYTRITYPFRKGNATDSLYFIKQLKKRLIESACMDSGINMPDTVQLTKAIKKYQIKHALTVDGKYGKNVINSLNNNDVEKFYRIAVTMDKYKQLPEKMPETYIWVNLPGYYLRVFNADTIVFESKVICGKPDTRTPLLTAKISDMITYPTWTVPNSIIVKQYLPKLKNNPNYISRIGLKTIKVK